MRERWCPRLHLKPIFPFRICLRRIFIWLWTDWISRRFSRSSFCRIRLQWCGCLCAALAASLRGKTISSIWIIPFGFIDSHSSPVPFHFESCLPCVAPMKMPWKCIRLYFVYVESHRCPRCAFLHWLPFKWNDTNVCDALQNIVSSQSWRTAAGARN